MEVRNYIIEYMIILLIQLDNFIFEQISLHQLQIQNELAKASSIMPATAIENDSQEFQLNV